MEDIWQAGSLLYLNRKYSILMSFTLERTRLDKIKSLKERIEESKHQLKVAQRQGEYELASRLRFSTIPDLERQLPVEAEQGEDSTSPLQCSIIGSHRMIFPEW